MLRTEDENKLFEHFSTPISLLCLVLTNVVKEKIVTDLMYLILKIRPKTQST